VAVLVTAVAVVGALCLANLLLTFGVIRRLREHTELIMPGAPDVPVAGLAAGEPPSAFSTVTVDGRLVSDASGLRLVAFFSSSCSVCPERVEPFTQYLADHQIGKDSVLAVVVSSKTEPPGYTDRLTEVARVSCEPEDGALAKAFKILGYPAFCLLDAAGAVLATSYDPARLPEPAAI
jgi:hypothetical protein